MHSTILFELTFSSVYVSNMIQTIVKLVVYCILYIVLYIKDLLLLCQVKIYIDYSCVWQK